MNAITGTAPQPGTTFPWPELPMDLSRLPIAVFCPMVIVESQFMFKLSYSMRKLAVRVENLETL